MPPVLLLQLDNTTKQNKGKYLFGFLHHLVHHGVFQKIIISYLPVGHTHEDIDQMFSRFAIALRKYDALDAAAMGEVLRRSFTYQKEHPTIEHQSTATNYSGWIKGLK